MLHILTFPSWMAEPSSCPSGTNKRLCSMSEYIYCTACGAYRFSSLMFSLLWVVRGLFPNFQNVSKVKTNPLFNPSLDAFRSPKDNLSVRPPLSDPGSRNLSGSEGWSKLTLFVPLWCYLARSPKLSVFSRTPRTCRRHRHSDFGQF